MCLVSGSSVDYKRGTRKTRLTTAEQSHWSGPFIWYVVDWKLAKVIEIVSCSWILYKLMLMLSLCLDHQMLCSPQLFPRGDIKLLTRVSTTHHRQLVPTDFLPECVCHATKFTCARSAHYSGWKAGCCHILPFPTVIPQYCWWRGDTQLSVVWPRATTFDKITRVEGVLLRGQIRLITRGRATTFWESYLHPYGFM